MANTIGRMKDLNDVIQHFGSGAALARALGVHRQAVYMWRGQIPKGVAYQIHVLTDGEFDADQYLSQKEKAA